MEDNISSNVEKTGTPDVHRQLNQFGLSHFMDLEERKDLLMNNVDDPLCINGPETYDSVGWVPIKQEALDDDLEASRVTITELPFNEPIEERRWVTPEPASIAPLPCQTGSDLESKEDASEECRSFEGTDKKVVENILKESNTNEEVVEYLVKSETRHVDESSSPSDEDLSWDTGQETQGDDENNVSDDNDVRSEVDEVKVRKKWIGRRHNCDICNKTLSSKGSLRIHKKNRHQVVISFSCELCSLNFHLQRDLIKHRNEVHRGKDGRFTCKECGKYFSDYRGYLVHLKNHFDDLQLFSEDECCFKCDECGNVFSRQEGLQLHKVIAHNNDTAFGEKLKLQQKNNVCDTCGKRFAFRCLLRDHMNLHTGFRPYLCQLCGRSFAQKASLKQHTRTHNAVRPFVCDVCSQGFYSKGDLNKHSRKHTGERPYVCEMCGDGFSQSSHLGVHRRSHTGERPFKCDLCSRGFTKKGDVVRHRRIHTGELPYLCQVCGKAFRQSTQCSNHIKNHHPDAHETILTSESDRTDVLIIS